MSEIPVTPVTRPGPHMFAGGRPRRSQRAVRVLAVVLMLAGALALADAGVTLLWQEPLSALYAKIRQDDLSGALAKVEHVGPTTVEQATLERVSDVRRRVAFLAGGFEGRSKDGDPVGRIRIPRIAASFIVVKGTSTSDLESGPGIYSETVFPGMAGTTAIAGHRTTYLAPFRNIDQLRRGNRILLNMPYAHFTYTVIAKKVVAPTDVQAAVANVGYSRLVLSACTPLFSAAKRLLVVARLTRIVPVGAGRSPLSRRAPGVAAEEALVGNEVNAPKPGKSTSTGFGSSLPPVLEAAQPKLLIPAS